MSDYHAARKAFYAVMERHGMERDSANYCITIGRRLRGIYTESKQVATLEDEAVSALRNMLSRLPAVTVLERDEKYHWDYVVGGLEGGNPADILHIVPPRIQPVPVPLPPLGQMTTDAEPTASEVQRVLDAWSKPQPEKPKPPPIPPVDVTYGGNMRENMLQQYASSLTFSPEMMARAHEMIQQMMPRPGRGSTATEALLQAQAAQAARASRERAAQRGMSREQETEFRAELYARGRSEGWDDSILHHPKFGAFVEAMMRARRSKALGDTRRFAEEERTARSLYEDLKRMQGQEVTWGPVVNNALLPSPQESIRSLDQLREKEQRDRKRAKNRR